MIDSFPFPIFFSHYCWCVAYILKVPQFWHFASPLKNGQFGAPKKKGNYRSKKIHYWAIMSVSFCWFSGDFQEQFSNYPMRNTRINYIGKTFQTFSRFVAIPMVMVWIIPFETLIDWASLKQCICQLQSLTKSLWKSAVSFRTLKTLKWIWCLSSRRLLQSCTYLLYVWCIPWRPKLGWECQSEPRQPGTDWADAALRCNAQRAH